MNPLWAQPALDLRGRAALCAGSAQVVMPRADPTCCPALRAELARITIMLRAATPVGPPMAHSAGGASPGQRTAQSTSPDGLAGHGMPVPDESPSNAHRPDAELADLVRSAQQGDGEAFGELYDLYMDMVFRYVYYRIGSRTAAEDIVSETFLRALRGIRTFTWQGPDIGAWFITIARNLIIDSRKSRQAQLEFPTDDILSAGRDHVVSGPEESVLDVITGRALMDAVRTLSPDQQECVVLRFVEGLSVRETALAMGKNEGAIKALQYRAVRALARRLRENPA
ncbi:MULTISPECIES: sigma-70 family RNA polymerase sigma factor [unclassified Frankia]|uniref:sigma-70 family RNA polymerase sigma factor n=1 Tax=unclassified Frankia TaxID=2632575 RepID=UPI0020259B67